MLKAYYVFFGNVLVIICNVLLFFVVLKFWYQGNDLIKWVEKCTPFFYLLKDTIYNWYSFFLTYLVELSNETIQAWSLLCWDGLKDEFSFGRLHQGLSAIVEFMGIQLLVMFSYPFNVCGVCSEIPSLILNISNFCLLFFLVSRPRTLKKYIDLSKNQHLVPLKFPYFFFSMWLISTVYYFLSFVCLGFVSTS